MATAASNTRQLSWYFVLAYAISWALWLPLVASVQGWWSVDVPDWWHYLGAAGPIGAALIVSSSFEGRRGVASLMRRYRPERSVVPWLAFVVGMVLGSLALGMIVARLTAGDWPSLSELSRADNLPLSFLPLTLLIHAFTFGIGEETGWRGFALPRLQRDRTAMQATHVLALLWAGWHLPTFFENESFMDMGLFQLAGWLAGLWMGAIFLTWLFNSSGGNLLVAVSWHALFNQFSASEADPAIPAILTMAVIITAIVAIRLAGPEELTGFRRSAGRRQTYPEA